MSVIVWVSCKKKKIINLHGKILGNYANKRCDIYPNLLKLYRIDLNNIVFKKRANLLKILEMAKKNYNSYIKKNIVKEPNKSSIIQIINYLKLK